LTALQVHFDCQNGRGLASTPIKDAALQVHTHQRRSIASSHTPKTALQVHVDGLASTF